MDIASDKVIRLKAIRTKIADIANTDIAISIAFAAIFIGCFAALPLFVGDFFLILPGFWP